jgi:tetratricopeptide (TPR) repeat protein
MKRRVRALTLTFLLLGRATPLHASDAPPQLPGASDQPNPTAVPPAPEEPTPPSSAAPVPAVEDPALVRARAFIERAKSLFAQGAYDVALTEFLRAHDVLEGHPRQYIALHNIAVCYERLHRYDQAIASYEAYLARAPATEPDRAEVAAVVRALRSLLATIEVKTNVTAEIWVDDRRVGSAPGRVMVPAGHHTLELRAPLHEVERREVQLGSGETRSFALTLRKLSTFSGPPPPYFWASAIATGASLVAGGIFGGLALSANADAEDAAALRLDPSNAADRAQSLSVAADVCFGAAAVLGATSTVLYFVTDWSGAGSERSVGSGGVARRSRTNAGLVMRGSF